MGLDWLLMRRKPKPGKAKPFAALEKKLTARREAGASRDELRALEAELDALSIRAEEAIGAPRVGVDDRATLWWREHVYAPNFERVTLGSGNPEYLAYWKRPQAELLRDAHGKFVCELATEQGGLVQRSPFSLVSDLDYGGIGILDRFDFLGDLSTEAWATHDAKSAARYAAELRDATEAVVESGELSQSSSEYVTVMAAVAWLEFWSSRGFGFIAWS